MISKKQILHWAVYSALQNGGWVEAYLVTHPKTDRDIKTRSLHRSLSRWMNREDVKEIIANYGYVRKLIKGRVVYIANLNFEGKEFEPVKLEL